MLDSFLDWEYTPLDPDTDVLLSEIPLELLKEHITSQFREPLKGINNDMMSSFIANYKFIRDQINDEGNMIRYDNIKNDFIRFIKDTFQNYLGIGFPEIDDLSDDDALELIYVTYRFFIMMIKKNFTSIIMNMIEDEERKKFIMSQYEKRKDVTTFRFKDIEMISDYDLILIGNLYEIIRDILEEEMDVDTFFRMCEYDDVSYELDTMRDAFDNFSITGNFYRKYVDILDDDFIYEVESKVRHKILKKYRSKNQ